MAVWVKFRTSQYLVGGLIFVALVGLVVLWISPRSARTGQTYRSLPPTVGSPVPDFELTRLDGISQQLSKLKGTPVLINFWATWCAPCKEEMPMLERYSKQYAGKLVVLGVDSEEEINLVQPFIQGMEITFPILLDQSGSVSDRYFVKDFPYTFFVDQDGILRGQHLGLLSEDYLVRYLQTIGINP
jgi:thiol-disulfide isomerase/thioredoxin